MSTFGQFPGGARVRRFYPEIVDEASSRATSCAIRQECSHSLLYQHNAFSTVIVCDSNTWICVLLELHVLCLSEKPVNANSRGRENHAIVFDNSRLNFLPNLLPIVSRSSSPCCRAIISTVWLINDKWENLSISGEIIGLCGDDYRGYRTISVWTING